MRSKMRRVMPLVVVLALTLLMIAPASATKGLVTSGSFHPFADGPANGYDDTHGSATMIRTASGRTIVFVHAAGLVPGETYGSHVHKQACDDGNAGGHYSFGYPVRGGALDGSEIWPGPFTADSRGRAVGFTMVGATAGPDAVSVVIHSPLGVKIACADLG